MIAWDWLGLYAVIGALAGLGAGLFGIGGGAIMTPALLLSFRSAAGSLHGPGHIAGGMPGGVALGAGTFA